MCTCAAAAGRKWRDRRSAGRAGSVTIVAHVPNLFDRSRFMGRATFVDSPEEARAHNPTLLIVDLDRCDDVEGFRLEGPRVIGFGPHVDSALHERATEHGYSVVLARSVFFKRLPELLAAETGQAPGPARAADHAT